MKLVLFIQTKFLKEKFQLISACIFSIMVLGVNVSVAQNNFSNLKSPITYSAIQTSVSDLLQEIQKQTDYTFSFNRISLSSISIKKIQFSQTSLGDVLSYLHTNYSLDFAVAEKNIAVRVNTSAANISSKKNNTINGTIEGKVTDLKTGLPLEGATIRIIGTAYSTITDKDGNFHFEGFKSGSYKLNITMVGYAKTKDFFITVETDKVTQVSYQLTNDTKELSAVTVTGTVNRASDNGSLTNRRNADNIQDIVSAQTIKATASINTAQALQKAVGVSITDNKYVVVRGMTDRNVVVQLNGTRLSGANNDRNAVALDIIPASLLDYVAVEKTITADKPADATAGLVELHTKSFPDSLIVQLNVQAGFNDQVGLGGDIPSFVNSDLGTFGQKFKNHRLPQDLTDLAAYYPGGGNLGSGRDVNVKDATSLYNASNMAWFVSSANNQPDANAAKQQALYINKVQEELDPVITTSAKHVVANQNYALSFGNRYKLGKTDIGVVAGINYTRNTNVILYGKLNQYSIYNGLGINNGYLINNPLTGPDLITPNNLWLIQRYALQQNTGQEQINYGGLGSVDFRFNPHHEVSFNYLLNKGFESSGSSENGFMPANHNSSIQEYQLRTTARNLSNIQFEGNHSFGDSLPLTFNWKINFSQSSQEDPDYRNIAVYEDPYDYNLYVASNGATGVNLFNYLPYTLNGRFFRDLTEHNKTFQADIAKTFHISKIKFTNKIGGYYFKRTRDYSETFLKLPDMTNVNISRYLPNFDPLLVQNGGDLNLLVSPNIIGITAPLDINVQPGQTVTNISTGAGWFYYPIKTLNNYHGAYQQNTSLYEMLTVEPATWLKVIGGVRFENTALHANLDTSGNRYAFDADHILTGGASILGLDSLNTYAVNLKYKLQPFPSATAIFKLNRLMNLRLAYSKTLGRPELRELIPTAQFDPYQQALVVGNDSLINSYAENLDARWEWFRKPGEVFAVSAFYKNIDHQLEKTFRYSGTATYSIPLVTYRNNPEVGQVYGIELELRKDLGEFSPILKNITLGGNLLLAKSFTNLSKGDYGVVLAVDRGVKSQRPLFDQPNYVLNSYITYYNRLLGTTVNFYFNSTGQRLTQVNLDGSPNIYQLPQNNLDLIINKKITRRITLNGYIKNLLNSPVSFAYTTETGKGKYGTYNQTYYSRYYYTGREVALGLSYLF